MNHRGWIAATAVLTGLAVGAGPVSGALPGRNGLLAVVVVADGPDAVHRIDLITTDGRFVRRLPCLSKQLRCIDSYPAWSPDGRELAYSTESRGGRIVLVREGGGGRRVLAPTDPGLAPSHPTWSPTGSRLAFMWGPSMRIGTEIFTIARNGTGLRRIGRGTRGELPSWSGTGRIAVGGFEPPPIGGIRTFRARDGANLRSLTGGGAYDPDWSPGAKRIAYVRCIDCGRTNRLEIWTMRADGTGKRRLTRGVDPAWSPDAHLIAFTREGRLYTIPSAGGPARRIRYAPPGFTGRRTTLHMPAWQPQP